jgi:hypothetical protein
MNLQLPIEVANQIISYLGTRPYQEVFQIIQAMQEASKNQPKPDGAENE